MNKKVVLSVLSTAVVASMATAAFAKPSTGLYIGGSVDKYYSITQFLNNEDQVIEEINNTGFGDVLYVDDQGKAATIGEVVSADDLDDVLETATLEDFKGNTYAKADGTTYDPSTDSDLTGAPAGDLKVESVSAINGAQLEVKFGKAVDEATVVDSDGTLKSGVLTVSKVSGSGTITVDGTSLATLSADGTTLTVTAAGGAFSNLKYVVTTPANTIADKDGKFFAAYTSNVIDAADAVVPTITGVTTLNASTVRVNFSEPLASAGSWTFKFADGTTATVVPNASNIAKGYVDLAIDAGITAGKSITATIVGAKDYAGNLVNPNPATVTFTKGQLDGTKPTVQTVTPLGLNKFELKFSEEVQGLTEADVTVDGTPRTANDTTPALATTEAIITQDATDKTKYVVEIVPLTAGVHTIGIVASGVTDLSGETNNAFSKVVEFKGDTTAPKLVSSEVKKDSTGVEYLHLVFDEAVSIVDIDTLTATSVKDFVTTQGTIDLTGLAPVSSANKEYKVKLADVEFDPTGAAAAAAVTAGATYTVTLTGALEDTSTNDLGTTTFTFTRGTDALTVGQSVDAVAQTAGNPSEVKVTFDQNVDGATATNKANYSIAGVVIEKAEVRAGEPNVVYLTLQSGSNTLDGERNITINGVKTADGVAMASAFNGSVDLDENVAPTFTAALVANNQIKLTFSEAVTAADLTAADLDVYVGDTKEAETSPFAIAKVGTAATDTEFIITLTDALTPDEFAKEITVKVDSTTDVDDANGNKLAASTVVVSK